MEIRIQYKKYKYSDIYGILILVQGVIQVKLFDEIKPVFFIDNEMNNILNAINIKLEKINANLNPSIELQL